MGDVEGSLRRLRPRMRSESTTPSKQHDNGDGADATCSPSSKRKRCAGSPDASRTAKKRRGMRSDCSSPNASKKTQVVDSACLSPNAKNVDSAPDPAFTIAAVNKTIPRRISFEGGGTEKDDVEAGIANGVGDTNKNERAEIGNEIPPLPSPQTQHSVEHANGNSTPLASVPQEVVEIARQILRRRLCDLQAAPILPSAGENRRKLFELLKQTIVQACNNSTLLLGPRGCGKSMVLEHVLREVQQNFPDRVSVVRLNGLLYADDRSALNEIAKQLCMEHALEFSSVASFDENLHYLTVILREFSLSQKAIVFVLDEFDLFAQRSKQSLLYNLLNLLQSSFAQAAVIGLSCRLDADQLLEKRVRSRFSQRKLLFLPPSPEEVIRLLELVLLLPVDSCAPHAHFANLFNTKTTALLQQESTKQLIKQLVEVELSPRYIIDMIFRSVCHLNHEPDKMMWINLKPATAALKRRPILDSVADLSVLELCLLTAMKRLEARDCDTYNFSTVFKEYRQLQDVHNTCDSYTKQAALKAFEHLLERERITYVDGKIHCSMSEIRPVKMLLSSEELEEGLEASPVCPAILRQWFSHEAFK